MNYILIYLMYFKIIENWFYIYVFYYLINSQPEIFIDTNLFLIYNLFIGSR